MSWRHRGVWNTLTVQLCSVHAVATLPLLLVAIVSGLPKVALAAWLLSLVIMATGTMFFAVQPLTRLSNRVRHWPSGAVFADGTTFAAEGTTFASVSSAREFRWLNIAFHRATLTLHRQHTRLEAAFAEQELLMQEIHHRVKNNLQVVASLLNLQASRIRQPEARAEFQAARDRVRTLATLHRHLYAHGEVHTIDMREFLIELCGQLFQAMGEKAGERLRLEIEAPELKMSSDQAVPLALIVTEAVSNAVKYAFPDGRRGSIWVNLTTDLHHAELEVRDDGVGIPAGRVETEAGTRDGIGIQLIRGFARQLGATLNVEEGNGTRYKVCLPLRRKRIGSPTLGALAGKTPV